MDNGSFLWVKQLGRGVDHPPPSSAESRAIPLLSLWAFMACSRLNFTFTFTMALKCMRSGGLKWVSIMKLL